MKHIKIVTLLSLWIPVTTICMQEVFSVIAQMQRLKKLSTTLFVTAAARGDLAQVVALAPYVDINSQIDIEKEGREQVSALHMASNMGYTESVRFLLKQKSIDVTIEDALGSTPLHEASGQGHTAIVELLLNNGAQKVINQYDQVLNTPLLEACTYGHVEVVKILIDARADLRISGFGGDLPIHKASWAGKLTLMQTVLRAVPGSIHARNQQGETPLHLASSDGHKNVGCEEVMLFLLAKGAQEDINAQDCRGITSIWIASCKGHVNGVDALINAKADATIPNHEGELPLHVACQAGHLAVAEKLIKLNCSTVNAQSDRGNTPLHLATAFDKNPGLVTLLLQYKANPNIKNAEGSSSFSCARNKEMADLLREYMQKADVLAAPAWPQLGALQDENGAGPENLIKLALGGAELDEQKE